MEAADGSAPVTRPLDHLRTGDAPVDVGAAEPTSIVDLTDVEEGPSGAVGTAGDTIGRAGIDPDALDGLPVVTTGGSDIAAIDAPIREAGEVTAFSLRKRSLFGGRLDSSLPLAAVRAIGPDAVIVDSDLALLADDAHGHRPVESAGQRVEAVAPTTPALFSEVRHRPVVATDTGDPIGRVDRFVVDPITGRVSSMRLDNVASDVRFMSWRDVTTFGDDVVTVARAAALRRPDGAREIGARKDFRATRKSALDDTGTVIGRVVDLEFDRDDGRITGLVLEDGRIDGTRLRGIGPFAVVVAAD